MGRRVKIVLDVNVLVSGLFGGVPARAVEKTKGHEVLISPPIKAEMRAVARDLSRKIPNTKLVEFRRRLRALFQTATEVIIHSRLQLCRDPADDIYLETCQVGRAHYLITGDRDLLDIKPAVLKQHKLGRLVILTPAKFLREEL